MSQVAPVTSSPAVLPNKKQSRNRKVGNILLIIGVILCFILLPQSIMVMFARDMYGNSGLPDGLFFASLVLFVLFAGISLRKKNPKPGTHKIILAQPKVAAVRATPLYWADPTFLAFFKEYWDTNIKPLEPSLGLTIVVLVMPDRQEVKEPICVYLKANHGDFKPRITHDAKPELLPDTVYLAGSPAIWREALATEQITQVYAKDTLPPDPLKILKARILKSILPMANRIATRLTSGARPQIDVNRNVELGTGSGFPSTPNATETLDLSAFTSIPLQGRIQPQATQPRASPKVTDYSIHMTTPEKDIKVLDKNEIRKLVLGSYLEKLQAKGPTGINDFWKDIDSLPKPETFKDKPFLDWPFALGFDPGWACELLALRDTSPVAEVQFDLANQFFLDRLK